MGSPKDEEDEEKKEMPMYGDKPMNQIGVDLYRRIANLEKTLTGFDDENVSEWEGGEEVDPEKVEMQERIIFLEEQQTKTAEQYEQMRQTLSTVSEQVLRLKRKLRVHRTEALMALVAEQHMEKMIAFFPSDPEKLKETINILRIEHKDLSAKIAKSERKKKEEDKDDHIDKNQPNLRLKGNAIVAGTVPQLLGSLLSKINPDVSFAVDFLCVYTEFLSSMTIIQNIRDRYDNSGGDKGQRMRSFQMMKVWINSNPFEFRDRPELKKEAIEFIKEMSEVVSEHSTSNLIKTLEKKTSTKGPKLQIYVVPESKSWDFLEVPSAKIAKQWTLHDMKLYQMIDPRIAMKTPNELEISKRIVQVHAWIAYEMKQHKLSVIVKKFIEIIEHCRRLRNLFGAFTILDGVRAESSDAKKMINKGIKKIPDLNDVLSPDRYYANYKAVLEEKKLPSLPNFNFSLSIFQDSLAAPATIEGPEQDLINFQRYRRVAKAIQEMQFFQKSPYEKVIDVNPSLMGYIQALPIDKSDA